MCKRFTITAVGILAIWSLSFPDGTLGMSRSVWHELKSLRAEYAPPPVDLPALSAQAAQPANAPAYPLRASANHRYLVDQNDVPFLIKGESPQALAGISLADMDTYLNSRAASGVNTLWVDVLLSAYISWAGGFNTYDNLAPFTTPGDLSTPNEAYFARVDAMLNKMAAKGMLALLDPIETGGWLTTLTANTQTKRQNYGAYLGNRFKNFPNILWLHGNDFQTWGTLADDNAVIDVAIGIASADPNHLQTVELDFPVSDSLQDSRWTSHIQLNTAYSYYPQYDRMLTAYNRSGPMPAYFIEGVYEFQDYMGGYTGPHELRAQEYWVMLSGACGQLWGSKSIYPFPNGWNAAGWDTTPGFVQFTYANSLFASRAWYNLVPDQTHAVVTAGHGTYATTGLGNTSDYLTAARTADGSLVIAYMPTLRTISVDMTQLAGTVTAQWFDPTSGVYTTVAGSPFPNTGTRQFTPPGNNSGGDTDWILVLETQTTPPPNSAWLYLPIIRRSP